MRAAKNRNNNVAMQADTAKLAVQMREYSIETFNANAAANRKANVVTNVMMILSLNASGRVIASNSYRPAKFINKIVVIQTNAIAEV